MSPYLAAHAAYHRDGPPAVPWLHAMEFHHQCAFVFSTPSLFLLARPVMMDWTPEEHISFLTADRDQADGWFVWSAGGDLKQILEIAAAFGARNACFQRRTHRVHRVKIGRTTRLAAEILALR